MKPTSPTKPKQMKNFLVPITFRTTSWRIDFGASENKQTKHIMKKLLIAIALAATLPALNSLAQPGPGRGPRGGGPAGPGGHHPPPSPVLMALDANGDGVIDAHEIADAPKALAALDTNGDGKLTPDELRPQGAPGGKGGAGKNHQSGNQRRGRATQQDGGPGEGPDGKHPVPPLIAVLDANRDGIIDAQEIAQSSQSLLSLDKNGDGQLSIEEICPPPPGGGGPEQ